MNIAALMTRVRRTRLHPAIGDASGFSKIHDLTPTAN